MTNYRIVRLTCLVINDIMFKMFLHSLEYAHEIDLNLMNATKRPMQISNNYLEYMFYLRLIVYAA